MNEKKHIIMLMGIVFSVSLFSASLSAVLVTNYYNRVHFQTLGAFCQEVVETMPQAEPLVMSVIKGFRQEPVVVQRDSGEENILFQYGYQQRDFLPSLGKYGVTVAGGGVFTGGILFLILICLWHKKEVMRINTLTEYLEKINTGGGSVLIPAGEDEFSKLQDEIYKTVMELYQTREAALKARNRFADNLYNIAHQMKTPVTSLSLSVQMMQECSQEHREQICRQVSRLTNLEETLLLLSRIDSGALSFEKKEVDVFTLLELSADTLQELFQQAKVSIDIPEKCGVTIRADMEWTMEAVMNLLKNCMEHTPPGGCVHCAYERNPIYTQIRIWDTGIGFAKEEIPYLFDRFFRGRHAKKESIGIGLAISKEIIESQNGVISAENLEGGGACFEIRFYEI